ncbi:asparaginyl-tRNA synthetase [Saprolegnia parasitica CBS 223.65]|uniref:asparagine--tRNA ligase n=1 Tax=Saprolegnia parasitica (strain CBS 223.65) TaxID=695850 RepID=A0A067CHY7_SAPPC|nr:asparaginyl-tRNA synthetase [Saprolegnia parasitica CBS 223.65]KDO28785.1 asparaginyl-tRNA synthetase [Saprolegnia parasitica CBS 223.65]|eukprot:XP_012200525.1 asparaginyl-tRNA synthetase [Saprolegnia parasitica CBS 223.65]
MEALSINDVTPVAIDDATAPGLAQHKTAIQGLFKRRRVRSPAKGQLIEVKATEVTLYGDVADPSTYALSKKRHTLEHLREHAHLRPRSNIHSAAMRVRNAMAQATHLFFNERGFLYIHTPLITASDCEGAGEMFAVTTLFNHVKDGNVPKTADNKAIDFSKDFFGKPSYLTVSGQLNVETHCCALSDCYTFGPTFRAENSNTARHLAEFWMIEPEIAFADLSDDIDLAEDYLKYCAQYALDNCAEDLAFFDKNVEKGLLERLQSTIASPFVRLSYTDAIELINKPENLKKGKFEKKPKWGDDLGSEHERFITEQIYKKPVVLYNYPKEIKAFYMRLNDDGKTVAAADVLVPKIGEIIGGSQREERLDVLEARIKEATGHDPAEYGWYCDLRRYGTEIKAFYMRTGIENIRDAAADVLVPKIGEIIGGSQREERLDVLEARIKEATGHDPAEYGWYCDLRRYGTVPHAGFGCGFERLVRFVTGIENIRDVIPFPRWPSNASF